MQKINLDRSQKADFGIVITGGSPRMAGHLMGQHACSHLQNDAGVNYEQ